MKTLLALTALTLVGASVLPRDAAAIGCLSGAAMGGVAGHVAGHHTLLGAAAGCAVGHHAAVMRHRREAADAYGNQGGYGSPR